MRFKFVHLTALIVSAAAASLLNPAFAQAQVQSLQLISKSSSGENPNGVSLNPLLDNSGSTLLFKSDASNLVEPDANGSTDFFVASLVDGTIRRADAGPAGEEAHAGSLSSGVLSGDGQIASFAALPNAFQPEPAVAISSEEGHSLYLKNLTSSALTKAALTENNEPADGVICPLAADGLGRYIAFASTAPNIKGRQHEGTSLYLYDSVLSTVLLVDRLASAWIYECESFSASISGDGRYLAYESRILLPTTGPSDGIKRIYLFDSSTSQKKLISAPPAGGLANGNSYTPAVSANGKYVAFASRATNLVAGMTEEDEETRIYLYDVAAGNITLVSINASGAWADAMAGFPSISASGRYIAFISNATNLVPPPASLAATGDGSMHVYLRDGKTGSISRISDERGARYAALSLSANASALAFISEVEQEGLKRGCEELEYQVYAAKLDVELDALPITADSLRTALSAVNKVVRSTPARVTANARGVAVRMQGFQRIVAGSQRSAAASARQRQLVLSPAYEVIVSAKGKVVKRVRSKAPRTTIKLKPGSYTVKYRVLLSESGRSKKHITGFSPATTFAKQ